MRDDLERLRPAEVTSSMPLPDRRAQGMVPRPTGRITPSQQKILNARIVARRAEERRKNRKLMWVTFGLTMGLGLLALVSWLVWSLYRAVTHAASWAAGHSGALLGALFVSAVVLFAIGKVFGGGGTFTFSGTGRWK